MGRPTLYTPEIIEEICARLSVGETMEDICRDDKMPSPRTIRSWQENKAIGVPEEVSTAIARAREIGFDAIASDVRLVARGKLGSTGDVQRDKLIVETDLKLLAKWSPKKYGDSTILRGDKENPLDIGLANLLDVAAAKRQALAAPDVIEGECIDVTPAKPSDFI